MTEFFSEVAKRNFTKLQVHVVELFLQDQFVLEFRKVTKRHKGCRQTGRFGKSDQNGSFCHLECNRKHKTK